LRRGPRKKPSQLQKPLPRTPRPTSRPAEIAISIDLPDSRIAETIRASLEPETRATKGFRSRTTISSKGQQVRLRIVADDLVALRAASNSFLHFIVAGLKAIETVAPFIEDAPDSTRKA
jgi:KEOPS complex subunit Pcc1